jgi:formate hydrogenlyase subunit 3/multisubunit Na+/H+ antiporter MnhD subunit
MSGVLIKMGIYGLLRIVVLAGGPRPYWGALLVVLGLGGGALGIALALYQRDIKRILAYSSIENVGLVTLGVGVGMWGATSGRPLIATLGLTGGLLHVWNHAAMKGLLFLGAGSVVHGCHDQNIEALGGLGRRMPQTTAMLILGATAIAGLPPLNGFVSEWLLYSALLRGAIDAGGAAGVAMLLVVALVSLIGAMAALCFARLVGIALLGEPRSPGSESASESPSGMTLPMAMLSLLLILLAILPVLSLGPVDAVIAQLAGGHARHVPVANVDLSRLGVLNLVLGATIVLGIVAAASAKRRKSRPLEATWGCGYATPTPRMQYTARAVSELFTTTLLPTPIGPRLIEKAPEGPFPVASRLASETVDPLTRGAYEPFFARWAARFARLRWMQQGLLHVYISYIVLTLLGALAWSTAAEFSWSP